MTLAPGTRLGPYVIDIPVGAGGMGEVYRARDERLERDVAIKVLPAGVAGDPGRRARFEREAKAVAALSHPNILAIHDIGEGQSFLYAVTELLDGETLRDRLTHGPLPVRKAVDIAIQIARGLSAAHDKGLVHRDLKPENVFLLKDGQVKILDFGLARQSAETGLEASATRTVAALTDAGTVMGTVGYMAPEQVRGAAVDARTDLFAFGAVLYEILSGQRAFRRDTAAETMTAILREDPPELSATRTELSPALDRIVRHCLEKDPAQRFQTARDVAFALEAFSGTSVSGVAVAIAPPARRWWVNTAAMARVRDRRRGRRLFSAREPSVCAGCRDHLRHAHLGRAVDHQRPIRSRWPDDHLRGRGHGQRAGSVRHPAGHLDPPADSGSRARTCSRCRRPASSPCSPTRPSSTIVSLPAR